MDTLLSETGRDQVSQLASYLAKLGIHFDLVFSSDLTRALETAEIILNQDKTRQEQRSANGHSTSSNVLSQVASSQTKSSNEKQEFTDSGHCSGTESDTGTSSSSPSPSNFASIVSLSNSSSNFPSKSQPSSVKIRVDSRLRERSYGILEGKTLKDLREAARAAGFNEKNYSFLTPEGAESLEQVRQRIADFCNQLISQVTSCNTHPGINNNEPSHNQQSSNAKESSNNTASNDKMSSKVTSTTPPAMVKCNGQGNNITANGLDNCNGKPVSVLVTTHGGVIREFMRYFRDQYKCSLVPLHEPLRVTPNTGVNIFKVYYEFCKRTQQHTITKVDLLVYHDITHLEEPSEEVTREQLQSSSSGPRDVSILVDLFREQQSKTITTSTASPVEENTVAPAASAQFEAL